MRKIKIIVTIICIVMILANLYIQYDINEYKENTPNYGTANSGIGVAAVFIISLLINSIISCILLLKTLIIGFETKKIKNLYTILILGLIIFTFCFPILLVIS